MGLLERIKSRKGNCFLIYLFIYLFQGDNIDLFFN